MTSPQRAETRNAVNPRLSIVMSVYNNADSLSRSLGSLLDQTFTDFELIVINDGSTDRSATMLDELAARDARLRLIHQANAGLTRALITGCALARGVYIARHDADDVSEPTRMALQVAALDAAPELAMLSCRSRALGPGGEVLFEHGGEIDPATATELMLNHRKGPSHHGSVMFRASAYRQVGGYREAFYYAQDADLWLRLGEVGGFRFLPETLYTYRISPYSISLARREIQRQFGVIGQRARKARARGESDSAQLQEALLLRAQVLAQSNAPADDRRAHANGHYFVGAGLQRQGRWRGALYFARAIRAWPRHGRAWLRLLATPLLVFWARLNGARR